MQAIWEFFPVGLHEIPIYMSEKSQESYKNILKATSIFGGVQVYQIIIQIIKSKIIAVLLGPMGVGVLGLYQSAIDLFKNLTSMGLAQSAVRDVSEAKGSNDIKRIERTTTVVRKLVWFTGLFGTIVVCLLSPVLSKLTFGKYTYTIPFVCLSVILLLEQLVAGQKVILQGLRKLKDLALVIAIGSTLGLICSIPLYYIYGIQGIVPTLILNSVAALLASWWISKKVKISTVRLTVKELFADGRQMLVMGVAMSANGILSTAAAYVIRGYLRGRGGEELVGLFQAGFIIINTYVGLVFNAIATDYYPRLAAVNTDNEKCKSIICQQGEIASFLLAPMLGICLLFMPLMLRILYSDKFLPANEFIMWCCLGMMFRMAAWLLSYLLIAKAESKLFMYNELFSNIYYVVFSYIGYELFGLKGLGIAFVATYIVYFIQEYLIAYIRYGFRFSSSFIKNYTVLLGMVLLMLITVLNISGIMAYIIGGLMLLLTCYISKVSHPLL